MKNILLNTILLMTVSNCLMADWTLNAIYNDSDLKLDGAFRLKNGKRYSTFLDKKIKAAVSKTVTMISYKNLTYPKSQGLLCITLKSGLGDQYELFFDSQSTHSILWQRPKAKKITMNIDDAHDDTMRYARVFLKFQGQDQAKAMFGYDDEKGIALDLIIRGKGGVYTLELSEPAR